MLVEFARLSPSIALNPDVGKVRYPVRAVISDLPLLTSTTASVDAPSPGPTSFLRELLLLLELEYKYFDTIRNRIFDFHFSDFFHYYVSSQFHTFFNCVYSSLFLPCYIFLFYSSVFDMNNSISFFCKFGIMGNKYNGSSVFVRE